MRLTYDFDTGTEGFAYQDDAFRFTSQPDYASQWRHPTGGVDGSGALQVALGGVDNSDVAGMSGGWSTSFTLAEPKAVTVTFSYSLNQGALYEANEFSEVLIALDGELVGTGGHDHVARIHGDGQGGGDRSTGWQTVTLNLGELAAGEHTLTFGGYNNQKSEMGERTTVRFDNVAIESGVAIESSGPALDGFEAEVLELTNAFRVENGREPLRNDGVLNVAAEDWSRDMADGDFFRHSTPDQVREFGYEPSRWGENIAAGYATPEAVVQGWIDSPGHRANLLSPEFEEIGIGYHYLPNDTGSVTFGHYWTQVFGTEADSLV